MASASSVKLSEFAASVSGQSAEEITLVCLFTVTSVKTFILKAQTLDVMSNFS